MSTGVEWRELYQAAMLELRPEELRQRIDDAEGAILRRMSEIRMDDSNSIEEARSLNDALRGLRVLASTECKSSPSVSSGGAQSEASS